MAQPEQLAVAPSVDDDTNMALVDMLNQFDVPFLAGGSPDSRTLPITPSALLAKLAASQEARLRLALIPLLLRHPEFDAYVDAAVVGMPLSATIGFKCYFAAAVLLQRKYRERLEKFVTPGAPLPPRFFTELELSQHGDPDEGLRLLADRQAVLSGRHINWRGTYEHAAERLLTHMERRRTWNV